MNDKINLCEILKDCPKGTILYSPLAGEVEFYGIEVNGDLPIRVMLKGNLNATFWFTKDGRHYDYPDGECTLFPSREQRDWSKFKVKKPRFDPKTLKPFDKVIARNCSNFVWNVDFYSCKYANAEYSYGCVGDAYRFCIPYNDDTKHLVGTIDEAPEFYKYWED